MPHPLKHLVGGNCAKPLKKSLDFGLARARRHFLSFPDTTATDKSRRGPILGGEGRLAAPGTTGPRPAYEWSDSTRSGPMNVGRGSNMTSAAGSSTTDLRVNAPRCLANPQPERATARGLAQTSSRVPAAPGHPRYRSTTGCRRQSESHGNRLCDELLMDDGRWTSND